MPRLFRFEGKTYSLPDNTTDQEALTFIDGQHPQQQPAEQPSIGSEWWNTVKGFPAAMWNSLTTPGPLAQALSAPPMQLPQGTAGPKHGDVAAGMRGLNADLDAHQNEIAGRLLGNATIAGGLGLAGEGLGQVIESAPQIGAYVKGAAKGAKDAAFTPVPVAHGWVQRMLGLPEFNVPQSLAGGLYGSGIGEYIGGKPGAVLGGITGAAAPVVKGALQGGKDALQAFNLRGVRGSPISAGFEEPQIMPPPNFESIPGQLPSGRVPGGYQESQPPPPAPQAGTPRLPMWHMVRDTEITPPPAVESIAPVVDEAKQQARKATASQTQARMATTKGAVEKHTSSLTPAKPKLHSDYKIPSNATAEIAPPPTTEVTTQPDIAAPEGVQPGTIRTAQPHLDAKRSLFATGQELELPGSPAGTRATPYIKQQAQRVYGDSVSKLSVDQVRKMSEWLANHKNLDSMPSEVPTETVATPSLEDTLQQSIDQARAARNSRLGVTPPPIADAATGGQ